VIAGLTTTIGLLVVAVTVVSIISAVGFRDLAAEREKARLDAVDARDEAETSREETQRMLYASDVSLGQQAWEAGNASRVLDLLLRHRPEPGQADLRGFEWYYLWRLCHSERLTLCGHAGRVGRVAFSSDGKTLATGSEDMTAKLWDVETGRELLSFQDHASGVSAVALASDGTALAALGRTGALTIWDTATGAKRMTLKVAPDEVENKLNGSLSFSPDARLLVAAVGDQTVTVWDLATGKLQCTLEGHSAPVYAVAFAPDGKTIASATLSMATFQWVRPTEIRLWDATTGEQKHAATGANGGAHRLAFDPSGRILAAANFDGTIMLWDLSDDWHRTTLKGHNTDVFSVAFSPDGRTLASASADKSVKLWDLDTLEQQATLVGHIGAVNDIAFAPDGRTLASVSSDRTAKLWDLTTEQKWTALKGLSQEVGHVTFSPDSRTLATSNYPKSTTLWDIGTGRQRHTFAGAHPAFSSDGTMLATIRDERLGLWDLATGQERKSVPQHTANMRCLAFSPVDNLLAIGCNDRIVKFWNPSTGKEWMTRQGHTNLVGTVAFSPDGKTVATGSWVKDNTARLWDVATGEELATLSGHSRRVNSVAFAPDGKTLATGSFDHTTKLWDLATRRVRVTLRGHTSGVYAVDFSRDGERVATAAWDGMVRLWDPRTGQELFSIQVDSQRIWSMALSPDGKALAVGGGETTAKLLRAAADEEVENHPDIGRLLYQRADALRDEGNIEQAEPSYRDALAMHRQTLGEDHIWTAEVMLDLGSLLSRSDKPTARAEAKQLLTAALGTFRRKLAPRHPWHREAMKSLLAVSRVSELVPLLSKALADPDPGVRREAVCTIDAIGLGADPAVAPMLVCAMDDDDAEVVAEAAAMVLKHELSEEDAAAVAQRLHQALRSGGVDGERIWEAWFRVSSIAGDQSVADMLQRWPTAPPAESAAREADLHWLLTQLSTSGVVRINCGGEEYRSLLGLVWSRDRFFYPGPAAVTPSDFEIQATSDDALYRTERWFPADTGAPCGYRIPLPSGRYCVTLHFAEFVFSQTGKRQFDVLIEGHPVLDGYDPVRVGFATADTRTFVAGVSDGFLDVETVHKVNNPRFSAIEIRYLDGDQQASPASYSPRQMLADAKTLLAEKVAGELTLDDVTLARSAARGLENMGNDELAVDAYKSFAEIFAESDNEALWAEAKTFEGVARRLKMAGKPLELVGTKMDSTPFDWAAYQGKVVLVVFHTASDLSWRSALPRFKQNYDLYHDRGFDVVGISLDNDRQDVEQFLQQEQLPWITLHDEQAGTRHPMAIHYGVTSVPKIFLVDQKGKVVSTDFRRSELEKLLAESLGPPYAPTGQLTYIDLQSKGNHRLAESFDVDTPDKNLKELPRGEQTFGGVRFRIADLCIQLAGTKRPDNPQEVKAIPVNKMSTELYVFHGTEFGFDADGTVIGHYQMNYEDNTTATLPIVLGEDVRDWYNHDGGKPVTQGKVVWEGTNADLRTHDKLLRLYLTVWENPHPDKQIVSIDYVSTNTNAAPFCVAMTIEEPAESPNDP